MQPEGTLWDILRNALGRREAHRQILREGRQAWRIENMKPTINRSLTTTDVANLYAIYVLRVVIEGHES